MRKNPLRRYVVASGLAATLLSLPLSASATALQFATEESLCSFAAPTGWQHVDTSTLPPSIKIYVQGEGTLEVPPTLTFSTEASPLSIDEYLRSAKEAYTSSGYASWAHLGDFSTKAGPAQLMQIEQETQWGIVQIMQAVLMRYGQAYVLTASALKEEFPEFYQDFFAAIHSFSIQKNVVEMVESEEMRSKLQIACEKLKNSWPTFFTQNRETKPDLPEETIARVTFEQPNFQEQQWKPFKQLISKDFETMGSDWQSQVLNKMQEELLQTRPS